MDKSQSKKDDKKNNDFTTKQRKLKNGTTIGNVKQNVKKQTRNKGNNKITELRTIFQRESQNS